MPWLDWQFYVVTAAAVWGAWTLLRQLFGHGGASGPACGGCALGAAACAKRPLPGAEASAKLVVLRDRTAHRQAAAR